MSLPTPVPVWKLGAELGLQIAGLDECAERWHKAAGSDVDADTYELTILLRELRGAVQAGEAQEALFALLEERGW